MKDENARDVLIRGLKAALVAQHDGRFFDIGNGWDEAASLDHDDSRISIALNLWDGWADSAAHQWLHYDGITAADWPRFASLVIASLEHDHEIVDAEVLEHFAPKYRQPSVLSRCVARIRALFRSA